MEGNNVKINKSDKLKQVQKFIKNNILKKTKVLAIIGIILTVVLVLIFSVYSRDFLSLETETVSDISLLSALREKLITLALILLAGWVPYFYIPVIAYIGYIYILSGNLALSMILNGKIFTLLLGILPVCMDIITTSVLVAIGIYMCNFTSKKYKYAQRTSFSFLNVKIQFYEMTKNKEKYEKAVAKKEKNIENMKKNDVKIDYANILKIAPIMIIINLVVTIITYCIYK